MKLISKMVSFISCCRDLIKGSRVVPDIRLAGYLAGYPAFFDIRYPAGYPVSFAGYPVKLLNK